MGQAATEQDVETQKKGIVAVLWFSSTSLSGGSHNNGSTFGLIQSDPYQITCMRFSAIHICTPDTPLHRLMRSAITMKLFSNQTRPRLRFHTGAPVELRYILDGFGIPTENIPISWTGTKKLTYFRQWLIVRRVLEDHTTVVGERSSNNRKMTSSSQRNNYQHPQQHLIQTPAGEFSISDVVECPAVNDILFRQGTALRSHPGNVRFRSFIENELQTNPGLSVQQLMQRIVEVIIKKRQGRVLAWTVTSLVLPNTTATTATATDNTTHELSSSASASASASASVSASAISGNGSSRHKKKVPLQKLECWCTLTDLIQINAKIEYTVRDYIRNNPTKVVMSRTSASATTTTTTANTTTATMTTTKRQKQKRNRQNSSSHTTIFQSEESNNNDKTTNGGGGGGVGRCCRK